MRDHALGGAFTTVRSLTLPANPTINFVGMTTSNQAVLGSVDDFALDAVVPEPASITLIGAGAMLAIRRRRRRLGERGRLI